jgi:hypothetical protein
VISGTSIASDDGNSDDLWILADLDGAGRSSSSASFGMRTPGSSKPTPSLSIGASATTDRRRHGGADVPKQHFTSGLSHLEGKQVRVLYDGIEINSSDRRRRRAHAPQAGDSRFTSGSAMPRA